MRETDYQHRIRKFSGNIGPYEIGAFLYDLSKNSRLGREYCQEICTLLEMCDKIENWSDVELPPLPRRPNLLGDYLSTVSHHLSSLLDIQ